MDNIVMTIGVQYDRLKSQCDLPVMSKNDVSRAIATLDQLWHFDNYLDRRVNEVI